MMKSHRGLCIAAVVLWGACGKSQPPSEAEVSAAKVRVGSALSAAGHAPRLFELLGLMPSYTCGQPRSVDLARLAADARLALPCAEVTLVGEAEADALVFTFEPECSFREHTLTGRAVFRLSAGDERFDVTGDFQETLVDGEPVMLSGGYGECGDEKRYWVRGERALQTSGTERFSLDVHLAHRDGLPLIGQSTWLLTGPAELIYPHSRDAIRFETLEYELGKVLPEQGSLTIETASGTRLKASFTRGWWRLGEATIQINDDDPVTVPVVQ